MHNFKQWVKSSRIGGPIVKAINSIRWKWHVWQMDPTRHIRKILGGKFGVQLIQIGSNDGVTGDPLYPLLLQNPSWKVLLVEPVPWLFAKLKNNYRGIPGAEFENTAIGNHRGSRPFFFVEPTTRLTFPDLPIWFDQLGSFDRSHITRYLGSKVEAHIHEQQVDVIPIADLLDKHTINHIDLLHIDTEGADWEILKSLDLQRYQPKIILFEFKLLNELDRQEALTRLKKHYTLKHLTVTGDLLCILREC
jgi:FkbM family methyltransferase